MLIQLCLICTFPGKAPPNLPQGVPPLLHSQYLVGPGGLLPAYPVSTWRGPCPPGRVWRGGPRVLLPLA